MDKPRKLYVEMPYHCGRILVDDFLITIGKKQSNSVYHVAEVKKTTDYPEKKTRKFHVVVYKSDLPTALKRDPKQFLIPMAWNSRNKKAQKTTV